MLIQGWLITSLERCTSKLERKETGKKVSSEGECSFQTTCDSERVGNLTLGLILTDHEAAEMREFTTKEAFQNIARFLPALPHK